jgi:NADPH2:quinone reductase
MKAIQCRRTGDASVLEWVDVPKPEPRDGEVLVRVESIGVNFLDVYHRTGLYPMPLPFIPGSEGAGVIEETGERVAWSMVPGAYAEYAAVPADKLVPLPAAIEFRTAAAAMLQGLTAHYLATTTFALREGHVAVVHAAAGGVGGLLVQIAKQRGATVIATASVDKHPEVIALGADEVFHYDEDWTRFGANVVYDAVGIQTFDRSLEALADRGSLILYGQTSGTVPPFDLGRLTKKSASVTRPTLRHYIAKREELLKRAGELFGWIESGEVRLRIDRELPLKDAAEAHRALESRTTRGKVLLTP